MKQTINDLGMSACSLVGAIDQIKYGGQIEVANNYGVKVGLVVNRVITEIKGSE
ncbi:hypothetical protein HOK51_06905 [Candidatus Woesearchaeota archaeon]|jgi:hypothetical protein|nr:hypothetical protein [Candidatus Woesearchaeota archaeon]MBT6519552.1 hypothetical protein [Candidatus Woesearchaeota archaeon]MBT7367703.1 hypothetical protein [Candidatus Woesearchaeota archaeon]